MPINILELHHMWRSNDIFSSNTQSCAVYVDHQLCVAATTFRVRRSHYHIPNAVETDAHMLRIGTFPLRVGTTFGEKACFVSVLSWMILLLEKLATACAMYP